MPTYEWRHNSTGEIRETDSNQTPPDSSGNWKRVFSFGLATVQGAGQSKGWTSTGKRTT